jgi:hypothetical protein
MIGPNDADADAVPDTAPDVIANFDAAAAATVKLPVLPMTAL